MTQTIEPQVESTSEDEIALQPLGVYTCLLYTSPSPRDS